MESAGFLYCCFYNFVVTGTRAFLNSFVMDVEVGNSNLGLFDFCSDFCWSEKGDTIDTSKDEISIFICTGCIFAEFISL